jgi:NAD(P)-dependent dehydrogenase (short-subunit alcohol dehydrogenase family)
VDRTAVVTGGAAGIGRAVAQRFVAEGARVVIADSDEKAATDLASSLGDSAAAIAVDVSDEADVAKMVALAVTRFGRLDVAVNCAAARASGAITRLTAADWRRVIDVGLTGSFLSIKHEATRMIEQGTGGAIVNIVSINSRQPSEGGAAYCSMKAGLEMLVRCAAMELGAHGIRVTGIGPGLVRTPATSAVFEGSPEFLAAFARNTPLGRFAEPEEIAGVAAFLASDEASWISGDTLFVDGGALTREYPRRFELGVLPGNGS